MRRLSALDAQFLNVEDRTTFGHVGALIVLDSGTAPEQQLTLEALRDVLEPRLHLAAPFRQRLIEVPLGLGYPYWVDDPDFDLEYHLREVGLPQPGTDRQLGEQVARIHARPLDRSRPLWEMYLVHGLEGGRYAIYSKIHHAAIDGITGAEILATIMDVTPEPREVQPEEWAPDPVPAPWELIPELADSIASRSRDVVTGLTRSLPHIASLPGAQRVPGVRTLADLSQLAWSLAGVDVDGPPRRELVAPRTPFNGPITAHRRFAYGSLPLDRVKAVKNVAGMTVNDVVLTLVAGALRRWLLDHDALPAGPLVAAVPVSIRGRDPEGGGGNQVSVMTVELPTHLGDARTRLKQMAEQVAIAKAEFEALPATILQDLSTVVPTALSGLAARALFKLATAPGVPFNLFVSNVPGPQLPLYIAGSRVVGLYPVSAVTEMTGGLNITLFSYNGSLDVGLIACREMVPDVWRMAGYLADELDTLESLGA